MLELLKAALATIAIASAPASAPVSAQDAPAGMTGHERATMAVLTPLVAKWEGLRLDAYQDIVGVWTVCYGETDGVKPGDTYTKAECEAMLRGQLLAYHRRLVPSFTLETRVKRLPPKRHAAFDSLAYNVGVGGTGRSTAVRRLNAGDVAGACTAIGWWNKAGGRVVRGLVLRRAEEVTLCREGL